MTLEELGWAEPWISAFDRLQAEEQQLEPLRVSASQREHYRLLGRAAVAYDGEPSGRLRHEAALGELPVVGDWVAARVLPAEQRATVVATLPRRTSLVRKRPDRVSEPQVLAANLDYVFLVTSLNLDFNPRRIERALALMWEGGAQPVLLLSKLDLCSAEAGDALIAAAQAVALGVPVHALSAHSGAGIEQLARYLVPGRSIALIGSSGVGKSTLVNHLLGSERLATAEVREHDHRGRHTTTARELFVLPGGGVLIDTPGMRELALWDADAGVDTTFDDVTALAASCRFGDCRHGDEPGCALRAAIASGALSAERYRSYEKLKRELAHEARRHDQRARLEHRQQMRKVIRQRVRNQRSRTKF